MPMTVSDDGRQWFAVWTRSRHEHAVRQQLADKQLETFLPTVTRWSRWKDRRKKIAWPLFPGYCFARFDPRKPLPVLTCAGVVSIVSINGAPAPVSEAELNGIRLVVEKELSCDPCPLVRDGALVTVTRGPLRGVVGRLLCRNAHHATVILAVDLIGQGVRVQVDAADVSPA